MIVDCHSHAWSAESVLGRATGFCGLGETDDGSVSGIAYAEAAEPAQVTLVLGFVSRLLGGGVDNGFLADHVGQSPSRLRGFAGIDPTDKCADEELRRCREQLGLSGAVISPACQGFHPTDSRAMKLYEQAEQMALPLFFLQGEQLPEEAVMDYARPVLLDEVARSFPTLKIVITHLGFPWSEETMALLAKHPHVYSTISGLADKPWQAYRCLSLAHEYGVSDKLLFASGYPRYSVATAVESLYNLNKITLDSVLPAVPREVLRSIVERDSLTLLGLEAPPA